MIQEQLQQEILTRIDKLAEKLGVTVEYLWPHLVRYEVALGISLIFITSLAVVASLILARAPSKWDWDEDASYTGAAIAGLAALILIVFVAVTGIPSLIAPEAAAFKALLP